MNVVNNKVKYIVIRDGYRVSDKSYSDPKDPEAVEEKDFWNKVAKKNSHNENVSIVQYDPEKHGVIEEDFSSAPSNRIEMETYTRMFRTEKEDYDFVKNGLGMKLPSS